MNNFLLQNALLDKGRSRLKTATWPYDAYPDMPELDSGKTITLLDADGPGIVTGIHASHYYCKDEPLDLVNSAVCASKIILRVWYDNEADPVIALPFMDFLGDIEGSCARYQTLFFSKVAHSHNFRLEIPFRQHITIQLENPSERDLIGYTDLQYEEIPALPETCGFLSVDYRRGRTRIPHDLLELFTTGQKGTIAAHWLQIEADDPRCAQGEVLCEANNEVYIDGERTPSMEYLGTEDFYGYSWGFSGIQSDGYSAIIKHEELPGGGSRIGMLRCRAMDKIRYQNSCRIVMNYTQEYFSELKENQEVFPLDRTGYPKISCEADYISCFYYYTLR
jgi:hypothetical protein